MVVDQARQWTVCVSWVSVPGLAAAETEQEFTDWPCAREHARRMACLSTVRYVTVLDPHHTIAAEFDRYTGRWREYRLCIGVCVNFREPDGPQCDGRLYARAADEQVQCPVCAAWTGTRAWGMLTVFDTPYPAAALAACP